MEPPQRCYSFSYETGKRRYSFDILGGSQAEALARVEAIKAAVFEGEVSPSPCGALPSGDEPSAYA